MNGEIPHSPALAEADPESLNELFSRNPEEIIDVREKIERLVAEMRRHRDRLAAAEAAGAAMPRVRKPKALTSPVSAADLGV